MNRDKLESLVEYLHDPAYIPLKHKGFAFTGDFSRFRRCVPVEYDELAGVFPDATLEVAGTREQSIFQFDNEGLPQYSNLRAQKLDPRFKRTAGTSYLLTTTTTLNDWLLCVDFALTNHAGKWIRCPINKQSNIQGGSPERCVEKLAMLISGFSLTERYNAHLEFECGNGASVAIPLGLAQVKEVLRDRDKPETGNRRPALVHLVGQHVRMTSDDACTVREHLRGKIVCKWRGWDVVVHPPRFDVERLSENKGKK